MYEWGVAWTSRKTGISSPYWRKYVLKFPLCETCYQVHFVFKPDALAMDDTALGKIAARGYNLIAIGVLWFCTLWLCQSFTSFRDDRVMLLFLVLMIAFILAGIAYYRIYQSRVCAILETKAVDWRKRIPVNLKCYSLVKPATIPNREPPDYIEATFINDLWGIEFANLNGWKWSRKARARNDSSGLKNEAWI